jgi:hypothetical protein
MLDNSAQHSHVARQHRRHYRNPLRIPGSRALLAAMMYVIALAVPATAPAHHSTANFDMTKSDVVTGTVTYFSFTSPHSYFDMDVTDKAGKVHQYKVFTLAKVVLMRHEWVPGDMKVGDKVTVTGNPDRANAQYLYLRTVIFASGRKWDHSRVF